jgi:predicted N-acetyltransferase YhbS
MAYRAPVPLEARHELDAFSCGEASLDGWLHRHARGAMAAGSARVFVSTEDGARVCGFYALAASTVSAGDATARVLKGQPSARSVPAVLLGRLAVDRRHQGRRLGTSLLQDALLRIAAAGREIGIRVVLVHALGERQRDWYEQFGFESSPTDPLHLILLMKDLQKLVREFDAPA